MGTFGFGFQVVMLKDKIYHIIIIACMLVMVGLGCDKDDGAVEALTINQIYVGPVQLNLDGPESTGVPIDQFILITFNEPIDPGTAPSSISLNANGQTASVTLSFLDNDRTVKVLPSQALSGNTRYTLAISDKLRGTRSQDFHGREIYFTTIPVVALVKKVTVGGVEWKPGIALRDVSADNLNIVLDFGSAIQASTVTSSTVKLIKNGVTVPLQLQLTNEGTALNVSPQSALLDYSKYTFELSGVQNVNNEEVQDLSFSFFTGVSSQNDFQTISDDALLDLVQRQTFKYFYDFAHPASGMSRERNLSGDLVTSGGTGFGIMALIVGIERGFITREQGLAHMDKILTFLESADRFHGAWPHWMNGNNGDAIPFSANDNGGDLVETSFLVQGLITFRQYLDLSSPTEQELANRINALWQTVEWDWYTQGGQEVLYWHWSPDKAWIMNHPIKGYNESLITYVLAASSPAHSISKSVYTNGWAGSGAIVNGKSFYNTTLPLGFDYGGPLFFTHYSFLGLDPRNLSDGFANYWTQNVSHTRINNAHSIANPKNFIGYSDENWGLTASDNHIGYSAHSPTNDLGVISPTAALSSFPYTPAESMKALRFFYYKLGDRLWGQYGFYDAFNLTEAWTANSYLAIDQGPIVIMIENHRTGKLWNLFMSAPEVQAGLTKLGFTY